jgi:hypothetical protein
MIGDVIQNLIQHKLDQEGTEVTYGQREFTKRHGPRSVPTHYTTPGGGYYSQRPDLTRSGGGVLIGRLIKVTAPVTVPTAGAYVITKSYDRVIRDKPEPEKAHWWSSFSQALTGGFGTGKSGLI